MKLLQRLKKRSLKAQGEQGMAMAVAMLMGLMLTAASSGLLAKQLMLRRLGAAESYKQLAEMAATSGMTRLLAAMNSTGDSDGSPDLTYLWELNQNNNYGSVDSAEQQWDLDISAIRPKLSQPCYPIQQESSAELGLLEGDLSGGENMRNDGRNSAVQTSYRLRSYSQENDARTFEIEGYATQSDGDQVLSRSLLSRILSAEEVVMSNQHWGVLGAKTMELGPSKIDGEGLAIWLIDRNQAQAEFANSSSCSQIVADATGSTNASMKSALWPKVGDGDQFPGLGLFADHNEHSEQLYIDTSLSKPISRDGITTELQGMVSRDDDDNVTAINLQSKYLCAGKNDKPCLVKIEQLKLTDAIDLRIETGSDSNTKPVILRLVDGSSSVNLSAGRLCQASRPNGSSSNNSLDCNDTAKAEELVIIAPVGDEPTSCGTSDANLILEGNSLPAAVVLMPQGKTHLSGPADMNGLLWSSSLCAQEGLTLSRTNADGSDVVAGFRQLWGQKNFQFGRTAWRGLRGKKHDVFLRW
jgi:hypothetical protein